MTFWHKIQKNSLQILFFVFGEWGSFLAYGGQKTRKTLFRGLENPFFCRFLATRGQIWSLNIKFKKILFKIKFFVFYEEGSFLAFRGHKP